MRGEKLIRLVGQLVEDALLKDHQVQALAVRLVDEIQASLDAGRSLKEAMRDPNTIRRLGLIWALSMRSELGVEITITTEKTTHYRHEEARNVGPQ